MVISLEGSAFPEKILLSSLVSVQSFIQCPSYCLDSFLSPTCIAELKENLESPINFLEDPHFSPWSSFYLDSNRHRGVVSDALQASCEKLFGERLARHRALVEKSGKQSHSAVGAVRDLSGVSKLLASKKLSQEKRVAFLDTPGSGLEDNASTGEESVVAPAKEKSVVSARLSDVGLLALDNRFSSTNVTVSKSSRVPGGKNNNEASGSK